MDWFDTAFEFAFAYNQICWLAGGLVCFLLGMLCAASVIFEKMTALKVPAKIFAVRSKDEVLQKNKGSMYYSVFEYINQDGNSVLAESNSGSSSLLHRKLGTDIMLYIDPDMPERATRPGLFLPLFSLGLVVIGAGLIYHALTTYPFNIYSVIILLGIIAFVAFKIHIKIQSREPQKKKAAGNFKTRKYEEFLEKRRAIPLLTEEQFAQHWQIHKKQGQNAIPILVLLALASGGGGIYFTKDMLIYTQKGLQATGTVISIESDYNTEQELMHHSVVRFQDRQQRKITFKDKVGSNHPSHRVGDELPVLFIEGDPKKAIIDRGLMNWLLPAGLLSLMGLLLLAAVNSYKNKKKFS